MFGYTKIDDLRRYSDIIRSSERTEQQVVLKYGAPCKQYASKGVVLLYGMPCAVLLQTDFRSRNAINLRYGAPCNTNLANNELFVAVKYGAVCNKFKSWP